MGCILQVALLLLKTRELDDNESLSLKESSTKSSVDTINNRQCPLLTIPLIDR